MGNWLVAERIVRRVPWYPTQAKTGLEWGTQQLLTMKHQKITASRMIKGRVDPISTEFFRRLYSCALKGSIRAQPVACYAVLG